MFGTLRQDLRYSARTLARSPGFTAIAILTLALGVGANAAVFAVLDQMLLRTPPGISHPETLKRVHTAWQQPMTHEQWQRSMFSYTELEAMRAALPAGAAAAGYLATSATVGDAASARETRVTYVVDDYFGVLGVKPLRGRFFGPGEYEREIGTRLVVVSERFWENALGRSENVIGRWLSVGASRMEIIGVAPANFAGVSTDAADVWLPFNALDQGLVGNMFTNPMDLRLEVVVRAPSVERVGAVRSRVAQAVHTPFATKEVTTLARISDVVDPQRGSSALSALARLAGGAAAILLIACANTANLLLIRVANRDREITIRFALGSSRARLAALLLSECLLIAMTAAFAAGAAAIWVATGLRNTLVPNTHWRSAPHLAIALGSLAVAAIMALLAGVVPVFRANAVDLASRLRMTHRGADPGGARLRALTLLVQTALSMVLLAGAGLFVRSLWRVEDVWVPRGADDIVVVSVPHFKVIDRAEDVTVRAHALRDALASAPGVKRVALSANTPIESLMGMPIFLPDRDSVPTLPGSWTAVSTISPEYLEVTGTPLIVGRGFTTLDGRDAEPVVLVSETTARTFWPRQPAVGKCIIFIKRTEPCRRVIGVVQDVRAMKVLEPPSLRYYVPLDQTPRRDLFGSSTILIRAQPGSRSAVRAIARQLVAGPLGAGFNWMVRDYTDLLDPQLRPWRTSAAIFVALGMLAVIVAGVGTYGTVSYVVAQQTHEIGVRRALGADGFAIARVISKGTGPPLVVGVVTGVVLALGLGRMVRAGLFNVSPIDAPSLIVGAAIILLVGVVAVLAPLRAAVRVDPKTILSAE